MSDPTIDELKERTISWLGGVHTLRSRLSGRSRAEIFYPGSIAPELLRRSEEILAEVVEHARETIDVLEHAERAIAAARRAGASEALERAAKVADEYEARSQFPAIKEAIAMRIRALKREG